VEGLSPQTAFLWSAGQDKAHGWTLNGQKPEGEMLWCQYNSTQMDSEQTVRDWSDWKWITFL